MKNEDLSVCISEPQSPLQISDPSSPSQRPRRNIHQKIGDQSNGISWREEKDLKKALYASLNETTKRTRPGEIGETEPMNKDKSKQAKKNAELSLKRARVHAQRKFAQGSTPSSPIPTPLKMCSSSHITAVDVFPCRRPKTEDFLTFLCLRGTPILPPSLDFFSNWSRDDSCSEKSYYSEPDNFHDENLKDHDRIKDNLELRSSNDMSAFHRQASAKLSAVKQKLSSRYNDFQDVDVYKSASPSVTSNDSSKKRKSSVDETSANRRTLNGKKTFQQHSQLEPRRRNSKASISSLKALKEKYKKQLIKKKSVLPAPTTKINSGTQEIEEKLKKEDITTLKPNRSSKSNAQKREEMKKSLEKRKSLRSARKINKMTPTYLEVSSKNQSNTRVRRAKLVPPIVEVDSEDSEFELDSKKSGLKQAKDLTLNNENRSKPKKAEVPTVDSDSNKFKMPFSRSLKVELKQLNLTSNKQEHNTSRPPATPPDVKIPKLAPLVKPKTLVTPPINKESKITKPITAKSKDIASSNPELEAVKVEDETKRFTRSQKQVPAKVNESKSRSTNNSNKEIFTAKPTKKSVAETPSIKTKEKVETVNAKPKEKVDLPKPKEKSEVLVPKIKPIESAKELTKEKLISDSETKSKTEIYNKLKAKLSPKKSKRIKRELENKFKDEHSKIKKSGSKKLKSKKAEASKNKSKKMEKCSEETRSNILKALSKRPKLTEIGDSSDSEKYFVLKKKSEKKKNKKKSRNKTSGSKSKKDFDPLTLPLSVYLEQRMRFPSDTSSEDEPPPVIDLYSGSEKCSSPLPGKSTETSTELTSMEAVNDETDEPTTAEPTTSFIMESINDGTSSFETISNEMATATLPGELMFGSAEEIRGLMTSEFSGVFDENFPAGAILLTTRESLTQAPMNFIPELTPTKTVADASTNTCEEDIIACMNDGQEPICVTLTSSSEPSPSSSSLKTPLKFNLSNLTPTSHSSSISTTPTPSPKPKILNVCKKKEAFPGICDAAKLVEAPVYAPTAEEFQDPLEFIQRIQPEAEAYGICRIIPPASFKPECKVNDDMRFTAHNQYIHKMLYRLGPNTQHVAAIKRHLTSQGIKMDQAPLIGGIEMDLSRLYQTVQNFGGLKKVIEKKKWQRIADALHIPKAAQDRVNKLYDVYCKYLVSYETLPKEDKEKLEQEVINAREQILQKKCLEKDKATDDDEEEDDDDYDESNDCVMRGRSMSLSAFYRIARNTMSMWCRTEPTVEDVEKQYWKLVTDRLNHVVVHAGNIDSSVYGSGFPSNRSSPFSKHPWNLKILTNNQGTILRSMGPVSGVTIPTLHVGMLYTTGCWYRDPHTLPWIEYLHTGASKIWYGVPTSASERFRNAMKEIMPDVCTNNPIWLPSDTAMVPPSLLADHGASLSRTVQESGQFVVIFPSAFTSTICTGYVVSESVYFAPPDWLEMASKSFQDIKESCEPPAFSLDRLLFAIANDPRTQKETFARLLPLISKIKDNEESLRKKLQEAGLESSERLPLVEVKDKRYRGKLIEEESEQECEICRTQCYLSMVINPKEDTVHCLEHGLQNILKKDAKTSKLMYTYNEAELNKVVLNISEELISDKSIAKKKARRKLPLS